MLGDNGTRMDGTDPLLDAQPHITDEHISLARMQMRMWAEKYPRYIVFRPMTRDESVDLADLSVMSWGQCHRADFYKTSRNALKEAGKYGLLLHFDYDRLLIVDATEGLITKGAHRNEVSDSAFCERQAMLWMKRADQLKGNGK